MTVRARAVLRAVNPKAAVAVGVLSAVCLAASGCGVGMQDLPMGHSAGRDSYDVTVRLATADGLVLGADVRTGQRVIGRVASLHADHGAADVRVSLDPSVRLPDNVRASVELPSALGSPYIRLIAPENPSSGTLAEGGQIPEANTQIGPQVETALATLGTVVDGSGLGQLDSVVTELNSAFAGRSGQVRSLTRTLSDLLASAAAHQPEFDQAMALAERVSDQLAGQQHVVDGFLDSVPNVVDLLVRQKDQLSSLIDSTAQLATTANTILSKTPESLDSMLHDASAVVSSMNSFNGKVGETLSNMDEFLRRFQVAVKGDYLVFDGALDIPGGIDELLTGGMNRSQIDSIGHGLTNLLTGGAR